jgi:hypothetical protein
MKWAEIADKRVWPRAPGELVGALQDRVHRDTGNSRPAKSVRAQGRRGGEAVSDSTAGLVTERIWEDEPGVVSLLGTIIVDDVKRMRARIAELEDALRGLLTEAEHCLAAHTMASAEPAIEAARTALARLAGNAGEKSDG